MADKSSIEWTDATWTVVQGCDYESPGCKHCYVPRVLWRLMHNPNPAISAPIAGLIEKSGPDEEDGTLVFTGKVAMREDRLNWPLDWKRPRRIFVPSHGDIFHPAVTDAFLDKIFAVMALCPEHTFQVLTKRPERMRAYVTELQQLWATGDNRFQRRWGQAAADVSGSPCAAGAIEDTFFPLLNVWLGVSVEDQVRADERIPLLLETPAAKRFLSCEPLLGLINIRHRLMDFASNYPGLCGNCGQGHGFSRCPNYGGVSHTIGIEDERRPCSAFRRTDFAIDWVIAGGESGADARPMHPDWVRSLRDQCQAAGVPFFFKQWGSCLPGNMDGEDERGRMAYEIDEEHSSIDYDVLGKGRWVRAHGMEFIRFPHKNTGRKLDGREWSEFPACAKASEGMSS